MTRSPDVHEAMHGRERLQVLDFHVHVFPPGVMDPEAMQALKRRGLVHELVDDLVGEGSIQPGELVSFLAEQGVDHAVVLAQETPLTTGVCSSEFVGEFCSESPALTPFCSPNPFLNRDLVRFVERLVDRYDVKGIKLYPTYFPMAPDDRRLFRLYGFAQEAGLPVMVHTGISTFPGSRLRFGGPLLLDEVAVEFPDLRLVLAHGGRDLWFAEAFSLCRIHEHVYLEVSGLPPSRLLDYFPGLGAIPDKVIFGTDFPVVRDIKANIAAIRALDLPADFIDRMLGGTARKLLKLS